MRCAKLVIQQFIFSMNYNATSYARAFQFAPLSFNIESEIRALVTRRFFAKGMKLLPFVPTDATHIWNCQKKKKRKADRERENRNIRVPFRDSVRAYDPCRRGGIDRIHGRTEGRKERRRAEKRKAERRGVCHRRRVTGRYEGWNMLSDRQRERPPGWLMNASPKEQNNK